MSAVIQSLPEDVRFSSVSPDMVNTVWPEIVPMIERGLRHGQGDGTTSDAMRYELLNGVYTLWVAHKGDEIKAAVILSVNKHFTGKKVFVQMLVGSDYEEWQEQLSQLLADFRDVVGAMCVEASCRKGLVKALSKLGWRQKSVIMELR